ncbi:Clavaminate synthase-like protein [Lindgomyces ingoldianus]|uniref:Clavaminate synthase-like protein n=1 Tax=Lindgomyces ingoldianus TaxID=673940 RepID=A0ACB6QES6_9PLEO|nr:Clavaminate synthase-like protein [Lindgomyces ingoldianus]KAF2464862.1 Clavaminate synthase-like protein [Lindgomyces ingoldianus]
MSDISRLSARSSQESLRSTSSTPSIQSIQSEPEKLAPAVDGPMVWKGAELDPTKYVLDLQEHEIAEIRTAIVSFKLSSLPRSSIDATTFPLSKQLADKLSSVSDEVHKGRGVAVVRGLDTAKLNDEEAVIAFVGVSSYVCPSRATDSYANQTLILQSSLVTNLTSLTGHIRDATHDAVPEWAQDLGLAGSKLPVAMEFHSDRFSGDVLALHVRNDGGADSGGEQYVASFWKVYNELLGTEPAVLETMAAADWPFELKQQNKSPYLELGPTLFFAQGKPLCQLVKAPLLGSPRIPRSSEMPSLTKEQLHALEVVEGLARRFSTRLDRRIGDLQYINNLSIMHARSAYSARASPPHDGRHLLRMFLRDPRNMWAKPSSFSTNFDDPFAEGREQNISILDLDPWRKISGRESHG